MTVERVISILQSYVDHDLEGTEALYCRDVLMDICGCTLTEIKELGLDYLLYDES